MTFDSKNQILDDKYFKKYLNYKNKYLELKGGAPGRCHKKKEVDIDIDEYHKMIDKYIEDINVFLSSYYSYECDAEEYASNTTNIEKIHEEYFEFYSIHDDFKAEMKDKGEKLSKFLNDDNILVILENIYQKLIHPFIQILVGLFWVVKYTKLKNKYINN
jgi:hypothetical protein